MEPLSRQGFRCIAYDCRAHGRSSDPGGGFDFDTLAEDLAALIEQLNLNGLTLIGHSFASGEIVRYLARYGSNRVDRLVFVSPAAIPFLLKTPDNPIGIEAAAFDQLRQTFTTDFPGWAQANAIALVPSKVCCEAARRRAGHDRPRVRLLRAGSDADALGRPYR
jgi:non-heme chloroperoxidase